jgi:hypothetical protein
MNIIRIDHTKYKDAQQLSQRNTELLQQRNASFCVNTYCPNTDYFPLEQEKCPDCGKNLSKTIRGANPYERIEI